MISGPKRTVTSQRTLENTVIQLVATTLGKKPGSVESDEPLLSSQTGFDSFSLMELVLHLEDNFDIRIPDEDLDPDIFQSVQTIVSYLKLRLDQEK